MQWQVLRQRLREVMLAIVLRMFPIVHGMIVMPI